MYSVQGVRSEGEKTPGDEAGAVNDGRRLNVPFLEKKPPPSVTLSRDRAAPGCLRTQRRACQDARHPGEIEQRGDHPRDGVGRQVGVLRRPTPRRARNCSASTPPCKSPGKGGDFPRQGMRMWHALQQHSSMAEMGSEEWRGASRGGPRGVGEGRVPVKSGRARLCGRCRRRHLGTTRREAPFDGDRELVALPCGFSRWRPGAHRPGADDRLRALLAGRDDGDDRLIDVEDDASRHLPSRRK
jgi:hypothetical protein